jgi:acyl-CoA thioesterase
MTEDRASEVDACQRQADREWLGLEMEEDGRRAHVTLDELHMTPLDHLYGGMGLALTSALMEAATSRRLRWATTQFVSVPRLGDVLRLEADVVAQGRRTSQVRVTAHLGNDLTFQALGATGNDHESIRDGVMPVAPEVPAPDDCPPYLPPLKRSGYLSFCEMRDAGRTDLEGPKWWMRFSGRPATRPALLGMLADVVPSIVMDAIGEKGSGSSLDNTIRVGFAPDGEWALLEGVPEQAAGGYGYGQVRIWGSDGSLAGTASQTAALWHWRQRVTMNQGPGPHLAGR